MSTEASLVASFSLRNLPRHALCLSLTAVNARITKYEASLGSNHWQPQAQQLVTICSDLSPNQSKLCNFKSPGQSAKVQTQTAISNKKTRVKIA